MLYYSAMQVDGSPYVNDMNGSQDEWADWYTGLLGTGWLSFVAYQRLEARYILSSHPS
jgi:hypothetical protein